MCFLIHSVLYAIGTCEPLSFLNLNCYINVSLCVQMSLKLRLIRLLLVWLFFRVLNKQTGWLSDKLGVGMMDEPVRPPPRPQPGERYIKVFHESSPHPIHVRVRKPPGTEPG